MTRSERATAIGDAILTLLAVVGVVALLSLSGCGDVLPSFACPSPALLMTPACDADEDCSAFARTGAVKYTYAGGDLFVEPCAACDWGYVDPLHPVLTSTGPTSADCTYVFEGVQTCDLDGLLCRRGVNVTYKSVAQ